MSKGNSIPTFDLFCGAGGSSRGAQMAGALPVAGLDMSKMAAQTYKLNFPEATTYRMRASSLTPRRVLEEVGPIDLLLASPECTSHSVAKGGARGCENSRETAFDVVRFAKVLQPRWIVVENVAQMKRWNRFEEWLKKIERLGYKTAVGQLNAQDFGAPQSRIRLFVVCDRENEPHFPAPGSQRKVTVDEILGRGESKKTPWTFRPVEQAGRAEATLERAQRAIDRLGIGQPFIMVYYGTDGAGGFQTLDRPLRTVTTLDRFAYVRPNCTGYEMRMLQPPELAAAMGFPASHKWPKTSRRNRIRLIGNAVCPPVMRDIVRALTGSKTPSPVGR